MDFGDSFFEDLDECDEGNDLKPTEKVLYTAKRCEPEVRLYQLRAGVCLDHSPTHASLTEEKESWGGIKLCCTVSPNQLLDSGQSHDQATWSICNCQRGDTPIDAVVRAATGLISES